MAVMSNIMVMFEKQVREWVAKNYGSINMTKPQYSITRVGQGQYDVTLSLSGLGVQRIGIAIVGDDLVIRGKIALIGENSSFPFQLIQELVNSTIQQWIQNGLDSASVRDDNTIKLAGLEHVSLLSEPLPAALGARTFDV